MTLSRVSLGVRRSKPKRLLEQIWEVIRTAVLISTLIGALLTAAPIHAQVNIEQIVAQKVQPILPKKGSGGGVAVAVRMDGKASFFNYGMADNAQNRQVTADSIFNLGSVGKVFATTLLAQAVKQGELSLDDPVAKYVTELQRGGDIRRITLGQLASHSSGLPRVRSNMKRGTEVDIRGQILFASLSPGKRPRTMNLGNNTSIPMRRWSCCESLLNGASTRVSRP
jgi:CubicO group peptidase (beta-lactamase class C family)